MGQILQNAKRTSVVSKISKKERDEIAEFYYSNNRKELKKIVNQVLDKEFPWIKDREEFEALAGLWIAALLDTYDGVRDFRGYLFPVLQKKFKSKISYDNAGKRKIIYKNERGEIIKIVENVSLSAPIGEEDSLIYEDVLTTGYTVEDEIMQRMQNSGNKVEQYLHKLSRRQRKIVKLLENGYDSLEIQKILDISARQFYDDMKTIKEPRNINVLR